MIRVATPHLRVIKGGDGQDAFIYHSLFGNPRVVSAETLDFLAHFEKPTDVSAIVENCDAPVGELLQEFEQLHFLVSPDENEKELIFKRRAELLERVSAKQTIDRMGLAISDACNFGCTHCIHFQSDANSGQKLSIYDKPIKQLNMSWATARACIDQYVEILRGNGATVGKIHFGNAEPLINVSVIEQVLTYCREVEGIRFEFTINTNLSLLTRPVACLLRDHAVRIATSLDGNQMANDSIRVTAGGRGTYASIIEKFDLLEDVGFPLDGFSITVTDRNYHLVDSDVLDMAAERGMTSIAFDYDLVSLVGVPVSERVEKLMRLKRHATRKGIEFFGTWDAPFRNLTSASLLDGEHGFCAAVQGRAIQFNVDGSIKVCTHTTTKVGELANFDEVFSRDSRFAQLISQRFPGTDEYCSGCDIEGPCGGQCHVTREVVARSNGADRDRLFSQMCDFYRQITVALAKEYLTNDELGPE